MNTKKINKILFFSYLTIEFISFWTNTLGAAYWGRLVQSIHELGMDFVHSKPMVEKNTI